MHIVDRVPADHDICTSDGSYDKPPHIQLSSLPCLQLGGFFRSPGLLVASSDDLVRPSFGGSIASSNAIHSGLSSL